MILSLIDLHHAVRPLSVLLLARREVGGAISARAQPESGTKRYQINEIVSSVNIIC